mgnify:CR=1 FL=1
MYILLAAKMPIGGLVLIILVVLAIVVGNVVYNLKGKQGNKMKTKAKYDFASNLFRRKIAVSADNVSEAYTKKCIDFFQNMDEETVSSLAKQANEYYREYSIIGNVSNVKMPNDVEGKDILKWIYPKVMWIGNDEGQPKKMEFIVECECEWEPEHGLEIVVYDRRIIHIGTYDGDIEYWKEEYFNQK